MGAWEYAGTIRHVYSFAHAKYGAHPLEQRLFRDQHIFSISLCLLLGLTASRAPAEGPLSDTRLSFVLGHRHVSYLVRAR